MHILVVSHNYPFSLDHTFGFFCKQQAEALVTQRHTVGAVIPLLYSIKGVLKKRKFLFGMDRFIQQGVSTYLFYFPSIPKARRLRYFLIKKLGIYLLDRYIRKNGKPDIIHLQTFLAAEVAQYAVNKYDIPIVWTEHFSEVRNNALTKFEENLLTRAARLSKARIAVSSDFKSFLEKKLGIPVLFVPNVFDSMLFKLSLKRKAPEKFTFIHVAHISPIKNQERLLRAFKKGFEGSKGVKILIIGSGSDQSSFKRLIDQLVLQNQVETYGMLAPEQVYNKMCESNCFVLSSDSETFGVSLIEAMACGLPVVSTRCGGPESIITNERLGLLADKTVDSLAEAMQSIHLNFQGYNANYISNYAREQYSYEAIGARLTKIYEQCLS